MGNTSGNVSQSALLLLTIYKLSGGAKKPIAFEDVVIQAWRDFPEVFSLRGHAEFPDSNLVSKRLYGPMVKKGLVVSLKRHVVRLTDKGIAEAQRILSSPPQSLQYSPLRHLSLTEEERNFLEHAFRSRPFSVWREEKKESLVDYDVRLLLGFSSSTSYTERQRRLEVARSAIRKALSFDLTGAIELKALMDFLVESFPYMFMESRT